MGAGPLPGAQHAGPVHVPTSCRHLRLLPAPTYRSQPIPLLTSTSQAGMSPLFSHSGAPNPYLPWPKPQTPSPFSKLGILQLEYVLKSPRWQLHLQVLIRWICLGSCLSVAGPPSAQKVLLLGELMLASGFPCGSAGKESAGHMGDLSSIPGLGRSPGEGKGYPLQYSGLENFVDCIVHGVAKS